MGRVSERASEGDALSGSGQGVGILSAVCLALSLLFVAPAFAQSPDSSELTAEDVIRGAINHWRGESSFMVQSMTVHRPDWERTSSMVAVTRGEKDALVRFTAPAKDEGNATLKLDRDMWVFTPRLNKVVKLPASLMAQSWMGSDFSYHDLSRSDQLLTQYTLSLLNTEQIEGRTVYTVEAVPLPDAPVVWGKEVLRVRDDYVFLEQAYYDQAGVLVKKMVAEEIELVDGRAYPVDIRMINAEKDNHWTRVVTESGDFDVGPPDFLFTLSNLRNPRGWEPK